MGVWGGWRPKYRKGRKGKQRKRTFSEDRGWRPGELNFSRQILPGTKTSLSSVWAVCSGRMQPVYIFYLIGPFLVNLNHKMSLSRKSHKRNLQYAFSLYSMPSYWSHVWGEETSTHSHLDELLSHSHSQLPFMNTSLGSRTFCSGSNLIAVKVSPKICPPIFQNELYQHILSK